MSKQTAAQLAQIEVDRLLKIQAEKKAQSEIPVVTLEDSLDAARSVLAAAQEADRLAVVGELRKVEQQQEFNILRACEVLAAEVTAMFATADKVRQARATPHGRVPQGILQIPEVLILYRKWLTEISYSGQAAIK